MLKPLINPVLEESKLFRLVRVEVSACSSLEKTMFSVPIDDVTTCSTFTLKFIQTGGSDLKASIHHFVEPLLEDEAVCLKTVLRKNNLDSITAIKVQAK